MDAEQDIRAAWQAGDMEQAATLVVRALGPELMGFLAATTGDPDLAAEAFGRFTEDLWRGLPGFRWQASVRTWAYTLARNAARGVGGAAWRRRAAPLDSRRLAEAAAEVRESTRRHLRTTMKDAVRELRAGLSEEERALLVLRVDRGLPWEDVSAVMGGGAPALRKRFERLTGKLRRRARQAGLLS